VTRALRSVSERTRDRVGIRDGLRDDEGSLPMVMLVMLIGLALGAVLVPTVLVQDRATVFVASRENSLAAAQAGIDVVVGRIRTATAGGTGVPAKIPCAAAASPLTGVVGTPNVAGYSVSVTYYVNDPVANPGSAAMLCVANRGTYDPATGRTVPSYAKITSTGTDTTPGSTSGRSDGRTLITTYVFQTTNRNVAGGPNRIYPPSGGTNMCLDAGSSQPTAGTVLALRACSTSVPPAQQQVYSYRSDLTLQLSIAASTAYPNGLCLDTTTSGGFPVAGSTVVLAACAALGSPTFSQQWSFNDSGAFQASQSDSATSGTLPNLCLTVTAQTPGTQVTLASCDNGLQSQAQAWLPAPSVGNGAAAAPQLVNFQQFGRCLDVTNQDVTKDHMIMFPCKQNPLRSQVTWNQKFTYDPSTGWLSTIPNAGNGVKWCLVSPNTENGWVRMTQCAQPGYVTGVTARQLTWTEFDGAATVPTSKRYTIVDSSTDATRCLSILTPPANDADWFYASVATCNGGTAQKWNADPALGLSARQNTTETP